MSESIRLCVGELTFRMSRQTIVSAGGMLANMFGEFLDKGMTKPQSDGAYFIDADPETFQEIIRYLRTGQSVVFNRSTWTLTRTQVERYTGFDIAQLDLSVNGITQELLKEYCALIFPAFNRIRGILERYVKVSSTTEGLSEIDRKFLRESGMSDWYNFEKTKNHIVLTVIFEPMRKMDLKWEPYHRIITLLFVGDYRIFSLLICLRRLFQAERSSIRGATIDADENHTCVFRKVVDFTYRLKQVEEDDH